MTDLGTGIRPTLDAKDRSAPKGPGDRGQGLLFLGSARHRASALVNGPGAVHRERRTQPGAKLSPLQQTHQGKRGRRRASDEPVLDAERIDRVGLEFPSLDRADRCKAEHDLR
jgi:hypothetical protein